MNTTFIQADSLLLPYYPITRKFFLTNNIVSWLVPFDASIVAPFVPVGFFKRDIVLEVVRPIRSAYTAPLLHGDVVAIDARVSPRVIDDTTTKPANNALQDDGQSLGSSVDDIPHR